MVDRDVSRIRRVVVRQATTSVPPSTASPEQSATPEPVVSPEPVADGTPELVSDTAPEPVTDDAPEPVPDSAAASPTPTAPAAPPTPKPTAAPSTDATSATDASPADVATPVDDEQAAPRWIRTQEFPYGFPTEALLDDHIAAADELRADLEQLRRQLDDGPPPLPPPRKRSRKPLIGILVVGAAIAAIGTAILVPWSDVNGSSTPQSTSQAGPADPGGDPAEQANPDPANPDPAKPGAAAAPAPLQAPAGSLPPTGPGITDPGTMMLVQVTRDGSLNVTEQAVLGPRGLRELNLRLPSMASLGGQVAELTPTVHNLRVSVNGTPVAATPTADGPGWAVVAAGGEQARTVQLSYQIQDAIVRTKPSNSGRALGVSLPLLGQALREQGLPLVVRAEGAAVGGATCPSAPTTKMLCGEEVGNGWLAIIPAEAASPTLLLQLDLS